MSKFFKYLLYKLFSINEDQCPICGYYCLGHGGKGCIDKPTIKGLDNE